MGKQFLREELTNTLQEGKKIFIPYMMAGDGGTHILEERLHFLKECGATAVEVGIPFSDPVADGPTVQAAGKRSLEQGTTLMSLFDTLIDFKTDRPLPIVIMTYVNPILAIGVKTFAKACTQAGVDGVIIPDLPMEEESLISNELQANEIAFIRLAALTSPEHRLRKIARKSEGFLYAVSVTGTTGTRTEHDPHVKTYLQQLKSFSSVPVLAGFGISSSEQAKILSHYCDGVVIGSKIVDLFYKGKVDEIRQLIQQSL
ncbi:MAG TPA: tryptophan synthase subunit alpha [Bacillota bacterium]|nr:tryptophan synthase subunit alpha [Bacillota bacterium]